MHTVMRSPNACACNPLPAPAACGSNPHQSWGYYAVCLVMPRSRTHDQRLHATHQPSAFTRQLAWQLMQLSACTCLSTNAGADSNQVGQQLLQASHHCIKARACVRVMCPAVPDEGSKGRGHVRRDGRPVACRDVVDECSVDHCTTSTEGRHARGDLQQQHAERVHVCRMQKHDHGCRSCTQVVDW